MNKAFVWQPTDDYVDNANLTHFMAAMEIKNYDALLAWADANRSAYWQAVVDYLGIQFSHPYDTVCDDNIGIPWTRWFVGGRINLAANCLDKHRGTAVENNIAIRWQGEDGSVREWHYRDLDEMSNRLANGLAAQGIKAGDAVGIYMPMLPETLAAFFALARLGAVVVPLFSGFTGHAISHRLNDASAVAVLTVDATRRRGEVVAMRAALDQALQDVASVRFTVTLDYYGQPAPQPAVKNIDWRDLVDSQPSDFSTVALDSDSPLLLVYTSGTTGRPKGVLLSHAGVTVKTASDSQLCLDFKATDRLLWMSDFGWIVGPLSAVYVTFAGGSILLAEGAPDFPTPERMWQMIQDHQVTYLGASPTLIRGLMRHGSDKIGGYDLSSLRLAISTGEPWTEEAWLWLFDHILKRKAPLLNIVGGTELSGSILTCTVLHALKPCSFTAAIPGTGADIVDSYGNSVDPDELGELVMRTMSPGITHGIWNDPDRYIDTYWSMFGDMWRHGDWAMRDADGLWYVTGRSDDTLKIAGKRTGPAEIEEAVMATGKVSEVAAIGIPDAISGQAVMCISVPAPGVSPNRQLADQIADAISDGLGKPFRPKRQLFVDELPKTRSLKIMRRVIRALILKNNPGDLSALLNPAAITAIELARDAAETIDPPD